MVELILVIIIAGILAAVAAPRMLGRTGFDTRGFADQLAATVRFAQKLAVAQHTDVYVRLTASDATLCYDAACATLAPGPGGEKPYTVSAPSGVAVSPAGFQKSASAPPASVTNASPSAVARAVGMTLRNCRELVPTFCAQR